MGLRLFFAYLIICKTCADFMNDMIVDYFDYKKVTSVVGYPCDINSGNSTQLLVRFSEINIRASLLLANGQAVNKSLGYKPYWRTGIFINTECFSTSTLVALFSEATNYKMYDEIHCWLIITNNLPDILDTIDDQAFGLLTDFVVVESTNKRYYTFYDMYNVYKDRGGILNVSLLGIWDNGFKPSLTQPKFNRRMNLHGLLLKMMFFKRAYTLENDTMENYLEDYEHATRDARSKFGYQIMRHLSDLYNFTFEIVESPSWTPGDPMGPITHALHNNSVDISGTPMLMSVARTHLMQYVHQDWPFRTCFIFRNPQLKSIKFQEILRPFSNTVWYLTGAFIIIIILILSAAFRLEETSSKLSDSVLIVIGAMCQQCTNDRMKRLSTRTIVFFVMIFSLLIYNYYSACVVSARLDEPIYKINDSLIELSKLNLKVSSEWIVYMDYFFLLPDYDIQYFFRNVWLKIPQLERFKEPVMGIELVRRGGHAYHLHPDVGYPIIEKTFENREICELMEVHLSKPKVAGFIVTLNSSFAEIMRVGLAKTAEVGLRNRQLKKWQYRKPECRKDILTASSVMIDEFSTHLILLLTGMVLAFLVYIVEYMIFINKVHSRPESKTLENDGLCSVKISNME